jgi:hypothetical protein
VVIDMFLRIIKTIDEEVVSVEVQRSAEEHTHNIAIVRPCPFFGRGARVVVSSLTLGARSHSDCQKDRMRDDCINTMVEIWYQILVTYRTSIPQLARECLAVLRPYISASSFLLARLDCCTLLTSALAYDSVDRSVVDREREIYSFLLRVPAQRSIQARSVRLHHAGCRQGHAAPAEVGPSGSTQGS